MGLQRKQGEVVQEGQQFDIRGTVEQFRHSVNMYMFWKPGMDMHVSHIRRRQIPFYAFPDGYKRYRPSRSTAQSENSSKLFHEDGVAGIEQAERNYKRKYDGGLSVKQDVILKRHSTSPPVESQTRGDLCPGAGGLSVDTISDCQGLKNVERVNLSYSGQDELDRRVSPECASNSSVVTSVSSDGGSPEDIGSVSVAGSVDASTRSVEAMISGRFEDTPFREESNELANSMVASVNEVLQDELQEQLEVLAFNSFSKFPIYLFPYFTDLIYFSCQFC